MRKEIKEYKFDWMLWTSCSMPAARLKSGTEKEYRTVAELHSLFPGH